MKKLTNLNSDTPLVSIITALYNAENYIEYTIKSVLSQTYQNWEHIIIDDCSTDNSVSVVHRCAENDNRIKLVSLSRNSGAAQARNKATELASGKYIAFLDADDLWHSDKLAQQIEFMQSHQCAVSYTNYLHIDTQGNEIGKRIIALPQLTYKKQHSNNYVGNLTGVYNAEVLGKINAPNFRKRQDWAIWLEAIQRSGKPALGIQKDLAYYRVHETSMSANKFNLVHYNYEFYKSHLGYGTLLAGYWLFRFFIEYFIVRKKWIEKYHPDKN